MQRVSGNRGRTTRAGFSLIEVIVVMAVAGILASLATAFITGPIQAFLAAARRAEMTDIADTALLRIARDVRLSLPNSLRVTGACTGSTPCYLEYLPVLDGGRYRSACSTDPCPAGEDKLDFTTTDTSFDVLGPAVTVAAGNYLVIYNTGSDPSTDTWLGGNRRTITAPVGTVAKVNFIATAAPLPHTSPSRRFFITDTPVTYACDPVNHVIKRYWAYGLQATEPTSFTTGSNAQLAAGVKSCSFNYAAGASQRNGQLTLNIQLENTDSSEQISLYREVAVNNEP